MVAIENYYHDNPNVIIMTNLDDLNQPHSCEDWGDRHHEFDILSDPLITDDSEPDVLWGWFNTGSAYPSTVYIDHTMTVFYKANNPSYGSATSNIDAMLDECGDLCTLTPVTALFDYAIDGNEVSFIDLSAYASPGWDIVGWDWNFGDGNTSNEQHPLHAYEENGNYDVSLVVTTSLGNQSDPYTDEIELNATLADVNANLDVSGTYTGGGLMTTGGNIVIPDAGNIGSASDTNAIAISSGGVTTFTQDIILSSTSTNSAQDPTIELYRNSSSPADGDALGVIKFIGRNDNSQDYQYARLWGSIIDASDTTEDGGLNIGISFRVEALIPYIKLFLWLINNS